MNLRDPLKRTVLIFLLLLLVLTIQGCLILVLNQSLLFSSLVSLLLVLPLAFVLPRFLNRPIQEMSERARRMISEGLLPQPRIYSKDELGDLAKAIDELGIRFHEEIGAISRERDYLRTVLAEMAEGVLVMDAEGRILFVNDALQHLFSLPPDVARKTPLEVIRDTQLEATIRKVLQERQDATFEMSTPLPNRIALTVNVAPISSSRGGKQAESQGLGGVVAVFHDITRLKDLERIRQDFVANVSHEIRTPLTTIKGYAETLLEGALTEEVASQFVRVIKRHADRLTEIVEDLLTLSRIESREFAIRRENISVTDLVEDAEEAVREQAGQKGITLSHVLPRPSPVIRGDHRFFERALINLLDNAIKYGREGGRIHISAVEGEWDMQISIQDDGVGIPKEDLSRIFERFYRVDKGRSKELGGTGLGLSIVKHIVQAHGGRVWAESELGKGSVFHLVLPKGTSKGSH